MTEKGLSRKDFLKAGGIAIAGAALFGAGGEVRALDVEDEPGLFVVQEGPLEGQELFVCTEEYLEGVEGPMAQTCPTLTARHAGPGRLKHLGKNIERVTSDGVTKRGNWYQWDLFLKPSNAWRPMEGLTGYQRQKRWLDWVFNHSLSFASHCIYINILEPGEGPYDSTFEWRPWEGYRCGGFSGALGCTGNGGAAPGAGTIWTTMRTGQVEGLSFEQAKKSRYTKGILHEMEHAIWGANHGQLSVNGSAPGTLMGCAPPGGFCRPGDIYRGRQFKRGTAVHR